VANLKASNQEEIERKDKTNIHQRYDVAGPGHGMAGLATVE
jgi:hypothetical protein